MEESKLNDLLERYRAGKATPEDKAFLESWYLEHNRSMPFLMSDEDKENDVDEAWSRIDHTQTPAKRHFMWYRIAAAASILLFLLLGSYYLTEQKKPVKVALIKNDITPGKNKATLTLANGKKVILNEAINGQLANQSGVTVSKTKTGELVYTVHGSQQEDQKLRAYNTLATANGEQYHVVLPDGTNVWLNAASSLKYPVAFTGNERLVELSGEAYFEVTHNKDMPFKVKTAQQEIQVLGTHFNINAYNDEPGIKTTLLQGKVKVTAIARKQTLTLQPGEQAYLSVSAFDKHAVDIEEAVAWKNGTFIFDGDDIQQIMRSVSRWYDVNVTYKGATPADLFSGSVSKFSNVSEVLNTLQATGKVHFSIEGKNINVYK